MHIAEQLLGLPHTLGTQDNSRQLNTFGNLRKKDYYFILG